jgi:hypothetical protein
VQLTTSGVILRPLSVQCLVISQALKHDFFGFSKETQEERNQKPLDEACIPQKDSWQATLHKDSITYVSPSDCSNSIGSIVSNDPFKWCDRPVCRRFPIITHSQCDNESIRGLSNPSCGYGVMRNL